MNELYKQQQIRNERLVPIYYMFSSDVPRYIAEGGYQGIKDIVLASGQNRPIHVFGPEHNMGTDEYSSADWYVQKAFEKTPVRRNAGLGLQIKAAEFFNLFRDEPWQASPHWEVFLTNQDLYADRTNYIFGETDPNFPASVQSVRRLLLEYQGQDAATLTRRLIRHEVGHMYGVAENNFDEDPLLNGHCKKICTMRQGLSVYEWATHHNDEVRERTMFCTDCTAELQANASRFIR